MTETIVVPSLGLFSYTKANLPRPFLGLKIEAKPGKPGSHSKKGWEEFTDAVIVTLSANKEQVVFML